VSEFTPFISRIVVFPIKSLDGVEQERATVLQSGAIEHDRTWALFDRNGRYVNGKRYEAVHRLRARFDLSSKRVSLRDENEPVSSYRTFHVDDDRAIIEAWLTKYFSLPIELRKDQDVGFPDDKASPGPTFISVATLTEIARWFHLSVEQVRARFRTNIEIDGVPPFWEDQLFDVADSVVRFRVGDARFEGVNPCQRCVVPARDPLTGRNDETFVRRFTELRELTLPEWSTRERFNHFYRVAINTRFRDDSVGRSIAVGDRLEILDRQSLTPEPKHAETVSRRPPGDFWIGELIIDAIRDETGSVKTFSFRDPSDGKIPFKFLSGQFLTVTVPDGSTEHQRCYTIASSPMREDRCEITVKREGTVSSLLHDHAQPGDRLAVSGPFGQFTFDEEGAKRVLFIAGGVGITPLMSKLRYLVDKRWLGRIDLVYSSKTSDEIIFRRELEELERQSQILGLHVTITAKDDSWNGARGRMSKEWLCAIVPDIAEREVHLCGPTSMAASIQSLLTGIGVPAHKIALEVFGGRKEATSTIGTESGHEVRFNRSGVFAVARRGELLLDTAISAGVAIDFGCRAGVCGRCKAKLLDGQVTTHGEFALTVKEKAAQFFLMCQAEAASEVVIDC
jgi:ferredoxin-NADP reductase/uncharacterized protein YcbX